MAKIKVELEEQEIANLHILVQTYRKEQCGPNDSVDAILRNTELKLAGALRSVGWKPNPEGGWAK